MSRSTGGSKWAWRSCLLCVILPTQKKQEKTYFKWTQHIISGGPRIIITHPSKKKKKLNHINFIDSFKFHWLYSFFLGVEKARKSHLNQKKMGERRHDHSILLVMVSKRSSRFYFIFARKNKNLESLLDFKTQNLTSRFFKTMPETKIKGSTQRGKRLGVRK